LYKRTQDRLRSLRDIDVRDAFTRYVRINTERLGRLETLRTVSRVRCGDVRRRDDVRAAVSSADLIITSPPYLGAQKYIRASSLSLLLLGLAPEGDLRPLHSRSVGREHFRKEAFASRLPSGVETADGLIDTVRLRNPQRAHLAATYLREMRQAIHNMNDVLTPGGRLVLVVGNNVLAGEKFPTPQYLKTIASEAGLRVDLELVDVIRSRGLMTRRNASAAIIGHETVLVMTKASA
jgi:tRNA G10  N-methylase Trm11